MSKLAKSLCSLVLASLIGCGDGNSSGQKRLGSVNQTSGTGSVVYRIIDFETKERLHYHFNLACYPNGVMVTDSSRVPLGPLRFYEAGPLRYKNVEMNDFFVLTGADGKTRVLQYFGIDNIRHRVYFNDQATGPVSFRYTSSNGFCSLNIGQSSFLALVETRMPFRLSVDQTGDTLRVGDQAQIVRHDGSRIREEDLIVR